MHLGERGMFSQFLGNERSREREGLKVEGKERLILSSLFFVVPFQVGHTRGGGDSSTRKLYYAMCYDLYEQTVNMNRNQIKRYNEC